MTVRTTNPSSPCQSRYARGRRLQSASPCDEKESMNRDAELASLRPEELIDLVCQLRQQLAEREQEIARLTTLLAEQPTVALAHKPSQKSSEVAAEPSSGTQEDLLTQLEKIYPGGQ